MPRLTEARRNDRRETLLEAAHAAFAEHGFDATSIAGIARRAGVSDGLLYRYFSDKRALLAAVLERYMEQTVERATIALRDGKGFAQRLERLIASQLAAFAEDPDICDLYIRELRDTGAIASGSPLQLAMRGYTDLLIEIVKEGIASGEVDPETDARLVRDLVFGGIEHIAWHSLRGGPALSVEPTAYRLAHLIARGVSR